LIQNDAAILRDYNGLDCLTVAKCTTGAQGFFPALSHRQSRGSVAAMLALSDAALARLAIGATSVRASEFCETELGNVPNKSKFFKSLSLLFGQPVFVVALSSHPLTETKTVFLCGLVGRNNDLRTPCKV
jgi:hypothetical protein